MLLNKPGQNYFACGLILLCLIYVAFEFVFNSYSMLSVDEFWFAHRIYQYKDSLPYRDFAPYKTVMGYYLLLIPMLKSHGIIGTLVFTKNVIAVLNAVVLFSTSIWLTRFFNRSAIITSLVLLVTAEIVLSYSTNIRVDLLAYWVCLFSLLLLLEHRYVIAGVLIGLGFIISQKTVWYLFASNCALGIYWLTVSRDMQTIWSALRFNLAAFVTIAIYILFWSWIADMHTVITSMFSEAVAMYQLDWYGSTRQLFWSLTLIYNPLLFMLWPLTIVSLLITYHGDEAYDYRLFIITYSFAIMFCLIPYKQVFPYYMQVTIPIFFILYAAFFSWLYNVFASHHVITFLIKKKYLITLISIYIITLICLAIKMKLPHAYLLISIIPVLLTVYLTRQINISLSFATLIFNIITLTSIFVGLIYPLTLFTAKLFNISAAYQKANIETLNELVKDGSDYIAGIDLLYNKSQPIIGMKHLMGPAIAYLYDPSPKLRSVMLASLDEDPNVTTSSVIANLKKSSVKAYVNNYRMQALPKIIQSYLADQYAHWWGSIYIYAPTVPAGNNIVSIKFNGKYFIESISSNHIALNGKNYAPNSIIFLKKDDYVSKSDVIYRLKLIPVNLSHQLESAFQNDNWKKLTL